MAAIRLQIYSRPGCHLCDEMKQVIASVAAGYDSSLEEIDISQDEALEAQYATDIPVLFVNGRKAFKYRVTPAELHRRLRREGRRSWW